MQTAALTAASAATARVLAEIAEAGRREGDRNYRLADALRTGFQRVRRGERNTYEVLQLVAVNAGLPTAAWDLVEPHMLAAAERVAPTSTANCW